MKLAPARRVLLRAATVATLLLIRATCADVLPDDRADLFYSKYSGGGMDITGESVAVRKKFTENFAISGNYFVDKVSGASIDVLSQASQIRDERIQKSATLEFVHDKTTYNATYQTSVERDYRSDTSSVSLKQDMFGDLTTLSLAFANTDDKIGENNGSAFVPIITWLGHASSRSYDIDLSQILTKNLIGGVNFNVITDQGYLANPYRSIRYLDAGTPKGYSLGSQIYPDTRTSTAIQGELKYFLPYRAAVTRTSTVPCGATWAVNSLLNVPISFCRQRSRTTCGPLNRISAQCNVTGAAAGPRFTSPTAHEPPSRGFA